MKTLSAPLGMSSRPSIPGLIILFCCSFPSVSGSAEVFKEWRPIPPESWTIAESDSPAVHHAVILHDAHIIDESDKDRTTYSRYMRIRLLDGTGVEDFRTVEIPFLKGSKIQRLNARTVKPSGETILVDEKDIYEKTLFAAGKRRIKAKAFAYKGVEPGDIVECFYTLRYDVIVASLIQLRQEFHTVESSVRWRYYPQPLMEELRGLTEKELEALTYAPAYVIPNGKAFGGVVKEFGDAKRPDGLDVTFRDLPALPDESHMPPGAALAVWFAGHYQWPKLDAKKPYWERLAKTWGEVTRGFLEYQDDLDDWMEDIAAQPRSIEKDLALCSERIRRDIRNSDLLEDDELPKKLPEVDSIDDLLAERIGGSFQVDYLFLAMMQKLGYKATIFHASNIEERPFFPELKSPVQFTLSGVAVKTEAGAIHYSMPHLLAASGDALPWEICGGRAFLEDLTKESEIGPFPALGDMPAPEETGNEMDLRVVLHVRDDGVLRGRLRAEWNLKNDPYFVQRVDHVARRNRKDAHELMRDRALRPELNWTAHEESLTVGQDRIAYACSLDVDGAVEMAGQILLVHAGSLRADDFSLPEDPRRTSIDFRHPMRYRSHVEIVLPEGAAADVQASQAQVRERFAEFQTSYSLAGRNVLVDREIRIKYPQYKASAAPAFREFFHDLYASTEQPLMVRKVGPE